MPSTTNEATNGIGTALVQAVNNPLEAAQHSLTWLQTHQVELIDSAIVLLAGFIAAGWLGRAADREMQRRNLDPPMRRLLVRSVHCLVIGPTLYIVLDQLGFKLTGVLAGVGVAGLGLGFGMQTLLGNMVAGLTIIFTKPYRVGEYIEILGVSGVVSNIDLLSTTLSHADTSRLFIPNQKVVGEILHNYGFLRQADLSVTVGYKSDLKLAQDLIARVLQNNPRVLRDPAPLVSVGGLHDYGVLLKVNPWLKLEDFGAAPSEIYEAIIKAFQAHQIEIPRPQHELRVVPAEGSPPAPAA